MVFGFSCHIKLKLKPEKNPWGSCRTPASATSGWTGTARAGIPEMTRHSELAKDLHSKIFIQIFIQKNLKPSLITQNFDCKLLQGDSERKPESSRSSLCPASAWMETSPHTLGGALHGVSKAENIPTAQHDWSTCQPPMLLEQFQLCASRLAPTNAWCPAGNHNWGSKSAYSRRLSM